SPSCAIAMPRSASAGASSRSATRFNAPRASPAARARAAAVISESIGIPTHLSLPSVDDRHLSTSRHPAKGVKAMTTRMLRTREHRLAAVSVGVGDWLRFAAAPTFAIMALQAIVFGGGAPDVLCARAASPLSGMVAMYLLMSVFHLAPWLRLLSSR